MGPIKGGLDQVMERFDRRLNLKSLAPANRVQNRFLTQVSSKAYFSNQV
jgi:hypothetical protein